MRKASKRDVNALISIYQSAHEELGKESVEWLKAVVGTRSRRVITLVAELHGEVAGFILAYRNRSRAYIDSLAVSEKYRGLGVGSLLLSEVERLLSERGVKSIYLSVKNWNMKALNFYLRKGYSILGVVLLMTARPHEITAYNDVNAVYVVSDVSASKVRARISKPLVSWSNLVDDVDRYIYRKLYREERALTVKKNRRTKVLVTYSINHEVLVDSITLSSYSATEALEATLVYLKNLALANGASAIEIPVDATKKKLVSLLENMGFKVNEVEYILRKDC